MASRRSVPPITLPAIEATWLRDGHIVFGIVINGEARAYPKRILAWHEMATDRLGGIDLTVVYCTLCGTVIPYESGTAGRRFTFGTSGLLYRSNKLMFDEETRSLWSSLEGMPVVGSLVGQRPAAAVPCRRDDDMGRVEACASLDHSAVARDRLQARLRGRGSVSRLLCDGPVDVRGAERQTHGSKTRQKCWCCGPTLSGRTHHPSRFPSIGCDAIRSTHSTAGGRGFLVVTSKGGANVVYERGSYSFRARGADGVLRDTKGQRWTETADALVSEAGVRLARVPAHRAFWFGWVAQYPETVLHK